MGLADRDYISNPNGQRGRATPLNAVPTDGVIFEGNPDHRRGSIRLPQRRRMATLLFWLIGGTAAFTILWAIACAMIGAQWHGQGATFTPADVQKNSTTVGSDHGAR